MGRRWPACLAHCLHCIFVQSCILFFPWIVAFPWLLLCSSVHSLSHVQFFVTPWTAARQASLSITSSQSLLKLMSADSVVASNHPILCRPLLLLPSIFPSIRVFSSESVLPIRWPKDWSFSFSINPSNEHSGLISFRMDWLDLLAVPGTLKSLLQHHSSPHLAYLLLNVLCFHRIFSLLRGQVYEFCHFSWSPAYWRLLLSICKLN